MFAGSNPGPPLTPRIAALDAAACAGLAAGALLVLAVLAVPLGDLDDPPYQEAPSSRTLDRLTFGGTVSAGTSAVPERPIGIGGCGPLGPPPRIESEKNGPRGALVAGGLRLTSGSIAGYASKLAGVRERVRGCYRAGHAAAPGMEGRVRVTVSVAHTGVVTSVDVVPTGSISRSVAACVRVVLESVRFAAPDGDAPASLDGSYAFVFDGPKK